MPYAVPGCTVTKTPAYIYSLLAGCTTRPKTGKTSLSLPLFAYGCDVCLYVRVCVLVCVLVSVRMCVCGCLCVFCRLCGLSQNIEFHGNAIPESVGVACGAIPDDDADANHRHFAYLHIICIYGYYVDDKTVLKV